ncbi:hypothetical protein CTI12_AA484930 [Artemisia annua]|uniref:arginine--tRNA ligase n=1 Tax=Artemisia annua TaxID=35608 RepID=A0A2U1LIH1_ARTAN|nr:hypothetical protein CTI12_AA484930 [Artemisia annua]
MSFQEEISKLFAASLKSSFPEFEQKPVIFASQEGQDGDYNCQNVMWIWPKLRKSPELRKMYSDIKVPTDVGEMIKKNLPKSAMIDGEASIQDENTFVYLLKTRARIHRITTNYREDINELKKASELILENNKARGVEGKERALEFHLLEFTEVLKDSCLFVSPHILCAYLHGLSKKFTRYYSTVRKSHQNWYLHHPKQQNLMIGIASRLLLVNPASGHLSYRPFHELAQEWPFPESTQRSTNFVLDVGLVDVLARDLMDKSTNVEPGKNEDNATVVFPDSMLIQDSDDHLGSIISETYPHLKQNLWSVEYFQERAILAPTHEMVNRINDRMLDLLEGDETLYQSSDSEFSNSAQSLQSFTEQEMTVNTRVAIENQKGSKRKQKGAKRKQEKPFKDFFVTYSASADRDPPRNCRFELFSIRPSITTDSKFKEGKLFGLLSVSDKNGLLLDAGSHLSEPDFTYVPLFNVDWSKPHNMRNGGVVCLGDPSSGCLIPFSSTIGIRIELNVSTEKNDACFHLCNTKFEIDTNEFWAKKLNSKCGRLSVNGEDGVTNMYYILLKDAVETVLEVSLKTKTPRKVSGTILAYYDDGCEFPFESYHPIRSCYNALLFRADLPVDLNDGKILLKRSVIAVPMRGSLTIKANLKADADFEQVILKGSHAFKPQRAVSDRSGLLPDAGSHASEPDFTYVPLFNVDWSDPINTRNGGVVCLGDPSSGCPIPFSSTIGIRIELNVSTEKNDACFHLCNTKFEIDLNEFWAKKLDSKCGRLSVNGEDGVTHMYYIVLKDAVDTVLEVSLRTKTPRKVTGTILAYYDDGCEFPFESYHPIRSCYDALLFRSDLPVNLNDGKITLKKSVLSVPMRGSLTIEADLKVDADFEQVILKGSHAFKPQRRGSSNYTIYGEKGTNCALDLKVNWDYKG